MFGGQSSTVGSSLELERGARTLMETSCGVRAGENVVILSDAAQDPRVADVLLRAARSLGAAPLGVVVATEDLAAHDFPPAAGAALEAADVIVAATSKSVFHVPAVRAACRGDRPARCVALSEGDAGTLAGPGMRADFPALSRLAEHLSRRLGSGTQLEITTAGGTHITASVRGRPWAVSGGLCRDAGAVIGLPTVETYVAPIESSVNGVAVIDGSCSRGIGLTSSSPIRLEVEDGSVVGVSGGTAAERLGEMLRQADAPAVYQVAEIGLPVNPLCRLTGRICEDEGVYGTFHLALGDNVSFGGRNAAPLHIDMVQLRATMTLDDRPVLVDGAFADGLVSERPELFAVLERQRGS